MVEGNTRQGRDRRLPVPGRHGFPGLLRLVTLVILVAATEAAEAPRLLRTSVDLRRQVEQVLMEISRGDGTGLTELTDDMFRHPPGRQSEADRSRLQRWTAYLGRALERAEDPAAGLTALNARYRRLVADQGKRFATPWERRERQRALAVHFLPAPGPAARLGAAADHAFDHGRFARYLDIRELLLAGGITATDADPARARRAELARFHSGRGRDGPDLPACGTPIPLPTVPPARPALRLRLLDNHLVHIDPWGQVVWQLPVLGEADVWIGDGGALVRDRTGLQMIAADGTKRVLPEPEGLAVLGVGPRAAWFLVEPAPQRADPAAGRPRNHTVHRLGLADGERSAFVLPARPLSPPLTSGPASLWLSDGEIFLVSGAAGRLVHRYRHGLRLGPGAAWHPSPDDIRLTDGERWYRLPPFDPTAVEQLVRAGAPGRALARFAELGGPTAAQRRWAVRAALVLGPAAGDLTTFLALAEEPTDRLRLLHRWDRTDTGTLPAGRKEAAAHLVDRFPHLLVPSGPDDHPLADPDDWAWLQSAVNWWNHRRPPRPASPPEEVLTAMGAGAWPVRRAVPPGQPPRFADLHWKEHAVLGRVHGDGQRLYRAAIHTVPNQRLRLTEISAHADDGSLLWTRRWITPRYLISRNLGLRHGHLLCAEGQARVHALDPATGAVRSSWFTPNGLAAPSALTVLSADRLAWVGPPGLDDKLEIFDRRTRILCRRSLPAGIRHVIALGGGRALVVDGEDGLHLEPAGVALTGRAPNEARPVATAAGIWFGEAFFAWTIEPTGQD